MAPPSGRDAEIGVYANLESMKAQKRIEEGRYDPADYRGVYSLWLLAYDDEQLARRARLRAMETHVERSCHAARVR